MPLQQSICLRCLTRLQNSRRIHSSALVARISGSKKRSVGASTTLLWPNNPSAEAQIDEGQHRGSQGLYRSTFSDNLNKPKPNIVGVPPTVNGKKEAFLLHLQHWGYNLAAIQFLKTLGIQQNENLPLLRRFAEIVKGELESNHHPDWNWDVIGAKMQEGLQTTLNATLMRRFLAVMPEIDPHYKHLARVRDALSLTHPAEWHPIARQVHRKIIMHVGPTNSGKTYHALRALAASEAGLYAGPLRLLATEIFGRLNKGDIAPTGADTSIPHPKVCNLLTGEEQRILDPDAPLISATVEMVPLTKKFDVVVIDEIQMIASPDRGNAWTQALLGLNANEIHLCGEESAVPLVKKMLKGCGDELIINRYERLTPLELAPTSLEGNFKRVQQGDCVIAFSKSNIFALKTLIEEQTGLKCAVVYGRLPPEVRVEQAEKFNKGLDNYSVLVASDAIGMGLNLKIKRIIFSTVKKWDGFRQVILKLSEMKQIAGRAGRFGMHGADAVGLATTFQRPDYPVLKLAMETDVPNLTRAVLAPSNEILTRIHQTLSPKTGLGQVYQLLMDTANCPAPFGLSDYSQLLQAAAVVDKICPNMTIATRAVLTQVPLQWQTQEAVEIFEHMLKKFAAGNRVDLKVCLERVNLMSILEDVNAAREEQRSVKETEKTTRDPKVTLPEHVISTKEASMRLEALELLHKMTCAYLWMSYRFPVSFDMRTSAQAIKLDVELGIEFCLEMLRTEKARSFAAKLQRQQAEEQEFDVLTESEVPSSPSKVTSTAAA